MIYYNVGRYQLGFMFALKGSVFPRALVYALPATIAAVGLKLFLTYFFDSPDNEYHKGLSNTLNNNSAYSGFTFVVGFLLVFRTSQAYTRFSEGATMVHNMRTEWFDACSSLIAFTNAAKDQEAAEKLRQLFVRLFSLLHSCALQDIAEMEEEEFELIDIRGLDADSIQFLHVVHHAGLSTVDLVFQWILTLITFHQDTGLIKAAPPILSRVYQELAGGMVRFSTAKKITDTPFPFPYAQMITSLLLLHLMLTPFVMCAWTDHWIWVGACTFVTVFSFWGINLIASEIEQPFGDDLNDLPIKDFQSEMNKLLLLLVDKRTNRLPSLCSTALTSMKELTANHTAFDSFNQAVQFEEEKVNAELFKRPSLTRSASMVESPKTSILGRTGMQRKSRTEITAPGKRLSTMEVLTELSSSSKDDEHPEDASEASISPSNRSDGKTPSGSVLPLDPPREINKTETSSAGINITLQGGAGDKEATNTAMGNERSSAATNKELQAGVVKVSPVLTDQKPVISNASLGDVVAELRRSAAKTEDLEARLDERLSELLRELSKLSLIAVDLSSRSSQQTPIPRSTGMYPCSGG